MSDRERLDRWSRAAVINASRFGWDATAAATLDVYRDALADRAGRLTTARG